MLKVATISLHVIRNLDKGLADRGGWHEESLAMSEIQAFF